MTEAGADAGAPIAIELRDIVKRFPGVVANDGVNLTVRAGTIHAIVGENGAGKSTLMKTLYGAHRPDEGTVAVDGVQRDFKSPRDAIDVGIGMVFQHFMLADNLRVWENIVIGDEPSRFGWLNGGRAVSRLRQLSTQYGLDIDPTELVGDLGVGEKQRTEILKVIYRGARILILDEPTAVLVPQEVDELFASLRSLSRTGSTVIFISHKLDEVLKFADAITVIRAGKTVGEIPDPSQVTAHELAEMMVGSELPTPETRESTVTERVSLSVADLTVTEAGRNVLDGVTFDVHAGEILGVAGVEGNGQTELIHAIMALVPATGDIRLHGESVTSLNTRQRREAGIGYVSEDRHRDGLVLPLPLWENAALGHQGKEPFSRGIWLDRGGTKARTEEIVRAFDVRTPNISVAAFTLSGGNQQKLVVGREMTSGPTVLVAAHPTRGVDVGAQALIWDTLRDARAQGLAVLLVSADLEELIGLSDRLIVMLRGKITLETDPHVTPAELGSYMTGAATVEGAA